MFITEDCSGCRETFTLDTKQMTVTMTRPSNGVRGKGHRPAEKVTAEACIGADGHLILWDCPLCGYAESEEDPA